MSIRRWMFFHPNDGTRPYPSLNPQENQVLWERIDDLEETVQRQSIRIGELNQQLQEYQGRIFYSVDNQN